MSRLQLFIIANVMALILAGWAWMEYGAASQRFQSAMIRLDRVAELAEGIRAVRQEVGDELVIEPESFDPSISVANAFKKAGLFRSDFNVSSSSLGFVKDAPVQRWRIDVPNYSITLRQAVALASWLAEEPSKFQVRQITVERPREQTNQSSDVETWSVSFDEILYLKSASQ